MCIRERANRRESKGKTEESEEEEGRRTWRTSRMNEGEAGLTGIVPITDGVQRLTQPGDTRLVRRKSPAGWSGDVRVVRIRGPGDRAAAGRRHQQRRPPSSSSEGEDERAKRERNRRSRDRAAAERVARERSGSGHKLSSSQRGTKQGIWWHQSTPTTRGTVERTNFEN